MERPILAALAGWQLPLLCFADLCPSSSKWLPDESERQLDGRCADQVPNIEGENCALIAAEGQLKP